MGLFDKVGLFGKAKKLAEEHADKVTAAIDKVAGVVDDKTGGKYAEKIGKGAAAAKDFVDGEGDGGHSGEGDGGGGAGGAGGGAGPAAPAPPPPAP